MAAYSPERGGEETAGGMDGAGRRRDWSGLTLVVGLGKTGLSCARFLARRGAAVAVTDSRAQPPQLDALRAALPQVPVYAGGFAEEPLGACARVIVSPGVSLREPYLARALARGLPVFGDIEVFAWYADAPVLAVTGSNGKSTVTALLGDMARCAGRAVRVGGNIGTPALDLLADAPPDLYVLELSSFQLETTSTFAARAAVVLNISPDHLDRHADLEEYLAAKLRIYRGAEVAVVNRDDVRLGVLRIAAPRQVGYGLGAPQGADFGVRTHGGVRYLARGRRRLMAADELCMPGDHNVANALAALALGEAAGLPSAAMIESLRRFPGLPHRIQWVAEQGGVTWYNDSKGTNIGATQAALHSMAGPVVLIAGGIGKGADFTLLRPDVVAKARAVVLIGQDATLIERALAGTAPLYRAADMAGAVRLAGRLAQSGDSVLLSPACASFDMFTGYDARGAAFAAAVQEVLT